jgi:cyclophilin family peptidyl-prolyl cis-trans isomerase
VPAALPEDPLPALVPGTLPGQESPAVYGARLVELAKLNATQLRAVAPVVLAVQRLWEQRTREDADAADGPAGRQLVCLWLGAGGSGKTWAYTQVLRPLFLRYFGARGVLAMANQNTPDSNGAQFYVAFAAQPSLDGKCCVIGRLQAARPAASDDPDEVALRLKLARLLNATGLELTKVLPESAMDAERRAAASSAAGRTRQVASRTFRSRSAHE